jgi:exoribonuclease R
MINLTDIVDEILEKNEPMKLVKDVHISDRLKYHLDNKLTLEENIFRIYSEGYFKLVNEVRSLYNDDVIELNDDDVDIIESDLGIKAVYEGIEVYLDAPIELEEDEYLNEVKHRGRTVHLSRPFRTPGGPKKFAVYVRGKNGNIKKVTFGDPKMRIRASSKARRKSFRARHRCSQKKDRTTAGYWSCRSHRIKSLGTKSKGKYW